MKPRVHLVKLLLLIGIFLLSSVLISQSGWFSRWRIDLTENHLFTLSDGTKQIVQNLTEPVHLRLYFSDKATADIPLLRTYHQRVVDFLLELERYGGNKLKVSFINTVPFSEREDEASQYGLQALPAGEGGDSVFFGIAGSNATDGVEVLPFLQPQREPFLEYDLARMIDHLNQSRKPIVGVLSDLPLVPEFNLQNGEQQGGQIAFRQLQEKYELRKLNQKQLNLQSIDLLILAHPKTLSEETVFAIDQFVMQGGRLLALVDPFAYVEQVADNPQDPMTQLQADRSSDLPKLFAAWGIGFNPRQVVLDKQTAISIQSSQGEQIKHLAFNAWGRQNLNQQDIMADGVSTISTAISGHFTAEKTRLQPLLSSSKQSSLVDADAISILYNPELLFQQFNDQDTQVYLLAGRLQGSLKSAFADSSRPGLLRSVAEPQVLLFADVDWLFDKMWVKGQQFGERQVYSHFADNSNLLMNLADEMTGSAALIKIHGRGGATRPFDKVEEIRRKSEKKYRETEQQLLQRLRNTESKLNQLQRHKEQQNSLILSDEQKQEINKFRQEKLNVRKHLREVKRNLNRDIETLGNRLKFINIALLPLLLSLFAIVFTWKKSTRRTQKHV